MTSPDNLANRIRTQPYFQTTLVVPPPMHGTGQWTCLGSLFTGGTVVLYTEQRFSATEVWRMIQDEGVTLLVIVGDVMGRLLASALMDVREKTGRLDVSIIVSSGAPLSAVVAGELLDRLPGLRVIKSGLALLESGIVAASDGSTIGRFAASEGTAVLDLESNATAQTR